MAPKKKAEPVAGQRSIASFFAAKPSPNGAAKVGGLRLRLVSWEGSAPSARSLGAAPGDKAVLLQDEQAPPVRATPASAAPAQPSGPATKPASVAPAAKHAPAADPVPDAMPAAAAVAAPAAPAAAAEHGAEEVGKAVRVYWKDDAEWFEGEIVEFDPSTRRHLVAYADGDEEWLTLAAEQFEFVEEKKKEKKDEAAGGAGVGGHTWVWVGWVGLVA